MIYIVTNGYEKAKKNKNDPCFLRNFIENK